MSLRTPLAAIIGYSELLEEQAERQGQTQLTPRLQKINVSANHLLVMISDILDISKIEAGKMELIYSTFSLPELIQQIITTTQPLIKKNQNSFRLDYDQTIINMYSDPTKVKQILLNLLSNAAKFTHAGQITLSVQQKLTDTHYLQFRVTDTGIGIEKAQLAYVFQPFAQADTSTTRQYGGTGLGLAICQQLCQMMNGQISVTSHVGEGSTFMVMLPFSDASPQSQ